MAQKIQVTVTDDLDGTTKNVRTFKISLDGKDYEIDLSKRNSDKLTRKLQPFLEAARKVPARGYNRKQGVSPEPGRRSREEMNQVRQWARERGYKVSERGRIAQPVLDAYEARK